MRPEHWLFTIPLRLRSLFRRSQTDHELDDELRDHLDRKTEEYVAQGMRQEEAHRRARLDLGGLQRVKEECRDARSVNWIHDFVQDSHFGLRMLRKNPGFTIVAVLTLALGIGANTAIFSLINAALLRMLPVVQPERLVHLTFASPNAGSEDAFSYPTFKRLRDENETFSDVLAFRELGNVDLVVDGRAELAKAQVVSGNYYSGLGISPMLGRTIRPEDDRVEGGAPVAVISYGYWVKRFNRNPAIVGKSIVLNGSPFTIIGITPPEFYGVQPGETVEVFLPIRMIGQISESAATGTPYSALSAPFRNWLHLMARLKPGVSLEKALANCEPIYHEAMRQAAEGLAGLPFDSPRSREMFLHTRLGLEPGAKGLAVLRQRFSKPLLILMAVVGLFLLIACANVANLMLARASARQREVAIRRALGAGRLRLIRQLLTESMLLAFTGAVGALALAFWFTKGLLASMSHSTWPVLLDVHPDVRVLSFTAVLSFMTAVLFGIIPGIRATKSDSSALKETGRGLGGVVARSIVGKALVVSQVALSLVLLIGASLLVRTLENLKSFYPGFNSRSVLLLSLNPSVVGYKEPQAVELYERISDELKAAPGVRAITFSDFSPLDQRFGFTPPKVEGYRPRPDENSPVMVNVIGPQYFKTLGTPVLLGREFNNADRTGAPKVVVINHAMAHYYFGDTNPLGRRVSLPGWKGDDSWLEIVGMVEDAKVHSLREQTPPQAYIPFFQSPESGSMTLEVRTTGDSLRMAATIQSVIREADSRIPVFDVKTLTDQVDESLVQERLVASLASLFSALALLMACVGLYGVMAYAVMRRTNEIGIRMALGAARGKILRIVLREALVLAALGVAVGIPTAIAATRLISSVLYDIKPTDPLTLATCALAMIGVAVLAGYVPARRAMRVDPMVALRDE